MTKTEKIREAIDKCTSHSELKKLWISRKTDKRKSEWPKGKLMEYLIVKAFELESK